MEDGDLDRAIAAMINSLSDEFDVDAASHVAALKKAALEDLQRDPRYQATATRVGQARIALRRVRIDVARKLQSNGVQENLALLDARLWHGRVLDLFIAELKPGEKLVEVHWWKLVTTLRTRTYHELKMACRMVVETNDAQFERNFESDETRRAAEAAEAERANPRAPMYGRNTDFPGGIRP